MREAEEVERLRFPFSASLPVRDRKRPELQKARLFGVQFERELPKPLRQFRPSRSTVFLGLGVRRWI